MNEKGKYFLLLLVIVVSTNPETGAWAHVAMSCACLLSIIIAEVRGE